MAAVVGGGGAGGSAPRRIEGLPEGSMVVRRAVAADNSCLFNAVGYVMEGARGHADRLRCAPGLVAAPLQPGTAHRLLVSS